MLTFFLTLGVLVLFATLMSVGLIFKGKALQGTCASQSAALMEDGVTCGVCGKAVGSCESDTETENAPFNKIVSTTK